ncbi:MAG: NAD(P)-dependent oxidoreductase [Cytophagales bacterium]|nr:NAD(P)-dependent oxidoreductase [Armatimonadota bacterium]
MPPMSAIHSTRGGVLVTGISGFIAQNLAGELARQGAEVLGVSRSAPAADGLAKGVRFRSLDLRDFAATRALLEEEQPRAAYHLAATSILHAAISEEGARAMLETNVAATWNVLEACRRVEVPVVVVASSDKQYGAAATPPYDDDSTVFGNGGVYELSKAQQDQISRLYAGLYDTPAVRVARLANIYGPGDTQWTRIVPNTIRRTVTGEPPRITAGPAGAALREYLFVDDAVAALMALATDAAVRGNSPFRRSDGRLARVAWNLSSGDRHPAAEVVAMVQSVLRSDFGITGPEPEVLPGTPGVFEPGHQFSKTDKLRALLPDWNPISLKEGLGKTIPWYLALLQASRSL